MLDFGTGNDHTNSLEFNSASLEVTGSFSIHFWGSLAVQTGTDAFVVSDSTPTTQVDGWSVRASSASSWKILLVQADASALEVATSADTAADTSINAYGLAITAASQVAYYQEGAADGTQTLTKTLTAGNADPLSLGDWNATSNGGAWDLGQVMVWDSLLTADNMVELFGKSIIPDSTNLKAWVRGIAAADAEEIVGTASTKINTVNDVSKEVDGYYNSGTGFNWLIGQIFLPFLVGSSYQFGSDLTSYLNQIADRLNDRCLLDWTKHELSQQLDIFRRRPAYGGNI